MSKVIIMIGISLGWNCDAAIYGVYHGIRERKENGYKTCPFDICMTNYKGICDCIKDDFADFLDDRHITMIDGYFPGEKIIFNEKYRFYFNHESPGHANLYLSEGWEDGINHFTNDNYKKFKERYARRIENFRFYLNSGEKIIFCIGRIQQDTSELEAILKEKYPQLNYEIIKFSCLGKYSMDFIKAHYKLMRFSDEEIEYECAT